MRVAVALLALLVAAPAADAVVVPQQGMKGLRLGMTPAQVKVKLGSPDRVAFPRHPIIGRARVWSYGLTQVSFDGAGADAKVITLSTTSKAERLANGVGVGSTRATVDRVPRVKCKVEFGYDHCFIGAFRAGRVVTDFAISNAGRVKRISVGRVID